MLFFLCCFNIIRIYALFLIHFWTSLLTIPFRKV
ncbi:hypothetical protein OIU79_007585 [Salix purpurea]|uniref:Uncharacterized protein n=1 Tax=Salix purpurea TaxID=77065 RepID=A0A9Q0TGE9_SALPP|nr:hypothetical protein OIU79_007585 [Salix purpurea]